MLQPNQQELQSTDLHDYSIRIIVAGSRGYNNRKEFHECIVDYLTKFDKPVLFISGAAPSGADRLIIQWCKKFKYPCKEMPADWDKFGNSAGYIRNDEMGKVGSHLLCFYNGKSPGTKNMIDIGRKRKLMSRVIIIKKEE